MPFRFVVLAAGLTAAGAVAVQAQPIGKNLTNTVTHTASSAGHTAVKAGNSAGHTVAKTGRTVGHGTAQTARHVGHGVHTAVDPNH